MEKQYNYFYKIENTLNGKFYYGVHGTDDLDDDYFGSGKRIKWAIKKYGKENFVKENLLFFETFNQALDYETKVVNEVLLLDPSCYNLKCGGTGGNNGKGTEWYQEHGRQSGFKRLWLDSEFREKKINFQRECFKALHKEGKLKCGPSFKGKQHTEESKRQIGNTNSIKQSGSRNSQYGKCWITNEKESKRIYKGDLIPDGWRLGRKMEIK